MRKVFVLLLVVSVCQVSFAGTFKSCFNSATEWGKKIMEKAKELGYSTDYPTPLHAFHDFVNAKSFVCSREAAKYLGLSPVEYSNSFRLPYTLNLPEYHMYNVGALVIQFTIKYEATFQKGELDSLINKTWNSFGIKDTSATKSVAYVANYIDASYDQSIGKLILYDKVFVYYIKGVDEWTYFGAESYFTGNIWFDFFGGSLKEDDKPIMKTKQ